MQTPSQRACRVESWGRIWGRIWGRVRLNLLAAPPCSHILHCPETILLGLETLQSNGAHQGGSKRGTLRG